MFRPLRLLLPVAGAALTLGFSACGTVYDRMYSYEKTHYKAPKQAKEASAADILGAVDSSTPSTSMPTPAPEGLAPTDPGTAVPPAGDIPGLPPAMPAPADATMAPPPL